MSSEHLSNLVVAVMKGEDIAKETAMTKEYPKSRMLSEGGKPVRCEFSLHEVLSGYARVTRLNGEEPKVRLGELRYCCGNAFLVHAKHTKLDQSTSVLLISDFFPTTLLSSSVFLSLALFVGLPQPVRKTTVLITGPGSAAARRAPYED